MNISIEVIYRLKEDVNSVMCFRHAVMASLNGYDIVTEADDATHIGETDCHVCESQKIDEVFKKEEFCPSIDEEDEYEDDDDEEEDTRTPKEINIATKGYQITKK